MLLVLGQQARASVERVLEIVDSLPEITEPADPRPLPAGPASVRFDRRPVRLPGHRTGAERRSTWRCRPVRPWPWSARPGPASPPCRCCCRGSTTRSTASSGSAGSDVRDAGHGRPARRGRGGVRGGVPVLRHHRRQHRLRPPGRHRRGHPGRRRGGRGGGVHRGAARRLRHGDRRTRAHPVRRPAAAARAGPGAAHRPARAGAGRRDQRRRPGHRGGDPRHAAPGHRAPDHHPDRPPPVDPVAGRPDRGGRRRPGGRPRHPRRAGRPLRRSTGGCSAANWPTTPHRCRRPGGRPRRTGSPPSCGRAPTPPPTPSWSGPATRPCGPVAVAAAAASVSPACSARCPRRRSCSPRSTRCRRPPTVPLPVDRPTPAGSACAGRCDRSAAC